MKSSATQGWPSGWLFADVGMVRLADLKNDATRGSIAPQEPSPAQKHLVDLHEGLVRREEFSCGGEGVSARLDGRDARPSILRTNEG